MTILRSIGVSGILTSKSILGAAIYLHDTLTLWRLKLQKKVILLSTKVEEHSGLKRRLAGSASWEIEAHMRGEKCDSEEDSNTGTLLPPRS